MSIRWYSEFLTRLTSSADLSLLTAASSSNVLMETNIQELIFPWLHNELPYYIPRIVVVQDYLDLRYFHIGCASVAEFHLTVVPGRCISLRCFNLEAYQSFYLKNYGVMGKTGFLKLGS